VVLHSPLHLEAELGGGDVPVGVVQLVEVGHCRFPGVLTRDGESKIHNEPSQYSHKDHN
jgi:hypothetical protein